MISLFPADTSHEPVGSFLHAWLFSLQDVRDGVASQLERGGFAATNSSAETSPLKPRKKKSTGEKLLAGGGHVRVEEQLRAANRSLRTINRCNEALVRATEEIELAEAICQILVEKMAGWGWPGSAIEK